MRRGGMNSHVNSLGSTLPVQVEDCREFSRRGPLHKGMASQEAEDKKSGERGCEVAEVQAFSQEVLMRTGATYTSFYIHQ